MLPKSVLIELLRSKGILAHRALGQNFLIDQNFLNFIIDKAQLTPEDYVLEIGSGPGFMTNLLAQNVKHVWAIEIDKKVFELSCSLYSSHKNITWMNMSILDKTGDNINPEILKEIKGSPLKVVSNLPYSISASIIMSLLESDLPISSMTLTVQLEMAERLTAKIDTKQYNALTILVNLLSNVKVIRKVSPDVFHPVPKVTSAVISITPKARVKDIPDYHLYKKLLRNIFKYRRKMVFRILKNILKASDDKIKEALTKSNIRPEERPEKISAVEFLGLFKELKDYL
jgi:16S rRNA (adenine1518-N6/adenine1519-N6)-dimethyltransferase